MRIVFDLDGTLCTGHPYEYAIPIPGAVHLLGDLRVAGHTIIIQTARGMGRTGGAVGQAVQKIGKLTLDQLEDWGFVYDEIYFGKPSGDLYVDDKACNPSSYSDIRKSILKLDEELSDTVDSNSQCDNLEATHGIQRH